jgi:hypothetical protein
LSFTLVTAQHTPLTAATALTAFTAAAAFTVSVTSRPMEIETRSFQMQINLSQIVV